MTPLKSLPALRRALLLALAASAGASLLTGCAPLVVGGAMVGGSMMVLDRRSSGAQVDDQAIELKATARIRDLLGDRAHVNVTSYNRMVLLTGEVPTEADRGRVEQQVATLDNVRSTINELAVMGPSSMTVRTNDAVLTSKVKATFVDAKDVQAGAFKVVTERSVVYLMGRVTEREAERATALARTIPGVAKVVRAVETIGEDELARLK